MVVVVAAAFTVFVYDVFADAFISLSFFVFVLMLLVLTFG